MIQNESRLLVADNSGAKEILVIRCLEGSKRKFSEIGDLVVATVKESTPDAAVKKGTVVTALILTTKKGFSREDGTKIKFSTNSAAIVRVKTPGSTGSSKSYLGTRIFSPIIREFSDWKVSKKAKFITPDIYRKILSISKKVV